MGGFITGVSPVGTVLHLGSFITTVSSKRCLRAPDPGAGWGRNSKGFGFQTLLPIEGNGYRTLLPIKAFGIQSLYIQRVGGEGTGRCRPSRRCCSCRARSRQSEYAQVVRYNGACNT